MGIVNWHKEIENDQLHAPKDFSLATKGDVMWKDGFNEIEWLQSPVLPAVLDLVTASSAPPTEVHGARYLLIDTTAVNTAWDGAAQNDWVEYDSSADLWINITPEEGALCYDKDTDSLQKYDGSTWSSASGSSGSFVKTDGTTPLTSNWDAGAYEITSQSFKIDGSGGDGHFHMRYQSAIPTGAANNSKLFAGSTGALGWVVDSNAYAFYLDMTGNTASRTLTVPNASGTIALTTDLTNIYNTSGTITDNARTITLAGSASTHYVQILSAAAANLFKINGVGGINAGSNTVTEGYAFGVGNTVSTTTVFASGYLNTVSGYYAAAFGRENSVLTYGFAAGAYNTTSNSYGYAFGAYINNSGQYSLGAGESNSISGTGSFIYGQNNTNTSNHSMSGGLYTRTTGINSVALGLGHTSSTARTLTAGGEASFNLSRKNASAVDDTGAMADYSFILGGLNHSVVAGAVSSGIIGGETNIVNASVLRSVVIGGTAITADVSDTVYVPEIAIKSPLSPANNADTIGSQGTISFDSDYVYVKTAAGWKRATLSTF